jgi:hypothetical protein
MEPERVKEKPFLPYTIISQTPSFVPLSQLIFLFTLNVSFSSSALPYSLGIFSPPTLLLMSNTISQGNHLQQIFL